jgi:hypothetical protein
MADTEKIDAIARLNIQRHSSRKLVKLNDRLRLHWSWLPTQSFGIPLEIPLLHISNSHNSHAVRVTACFGVPFLGLLTFVWNLPTCGTVLSKLCLLWEISHHTVLRFALNLEFSFETTFKTLCGKPISWFFLVTHKKGHLLCFWATFF